MQTLVVYDLTGQIIYEVTGNAREPIGIPFMWVSVPQGKYIARIDVSGETHIPVFEDLPKTEIEQLKEENTQIKLALAELGQLIGEMISNG